MVFEAHTANVFVFATFDLRPSCNNSWNDGESNQGRTGAPNAVQMSPKRPQHAPTRLSIRS